MIKSLLKCFISSKEDIWKLETATNLKVDGFKKAKTTEDTTTKVRKRFGDFNTHSAHRRQKIPRKSGVICFWTLISFILICASIYKAYWKVIGPINMTFKNKSWCLVIWSDFEKRVDPGIFQHPYYINL